MAMIHSNTAGKQKNESMRIAWPQFTRLTPHEGDREHDEAGGDDCLRDVHLSKLPHIRIVSRKPFVLWETSRNISVSAVERTSMTVKIALVPTPKMKTRRKTRWSDV